jgi:anaerobic magnesium-protoporphyrin IX monomethyl ester cyclase
MKILLVEPISINKGWPNYCPPIGLCYLKGALKRNNINEVKVVDLTDSTFDEYTNTLKKEKPDILGIACFTETRNNVFRMLRIAKQNNPKILTVLGGVHPTIMYEQILLNNKDVDIICLGESEITFTELIKNVDYKQDWSDIKGIAYLRDNKVINNEQRQLIQNLDEIPFPDYEDLNLKNYKGDFSWEKGIPRASILTSRGCPFSCIFCSSKEVFNTWRYRSATNVLQEIEWYVERGFNCFSFVDDLFSFKRERIKTICKEIIDRRLNIKWFAQTRADCLDEEILALMKKSGCQLIQIGVESGSAKILKNLNKRESLDTLKKAFLLCKKANMKTQMMLMVGSPGETKETIEETKSFIKEVKADRVLVANLRIFPGTNLMQLAVEKSIFHNDYWLKNSSYFYYTGSMSIQEINKYHRQLIFYIARIKGLKGFFELAIQVLNKIKNEPTKIMQIMFRGTAKEQEGKE